jgi:NADH dehydrogenase FAD-containing subunit
MLAGIYPPSLDQIDVGALVVKGGGRFIRARATAIDVATQTVSLDTGQSLPYDVLSCNLGSEVPVGAIPGATAHGLAVKPIRNLWELRQSLEVRMGAGAPRQALRIVIAGGGATGCEIAASIQQLVFLHGGQAEITILARGNGLLEHMARGTAKKMAQILHRRGIQLVLNSPVVRVESQAVTTAGGKQIPFDFLVHAVGLTPPAILRATGLPTSEDGALLVDQFLRSPAEPRVFGGGDCIAFQARELANVGVYAIREAPILCHNLLATLQGQPLRRFRPQRRFLLVLNLGDGTGLLTWGPFYWHSRVAFWIKDRIDRAFLRAYQLPQ